MMLKREMKVWLALIVVLAILSLGSACGGGSEGPATNDDAPTTATTEWKTTGDEGTVTGAVAYAGTPPPAKRIDTSADPVCGQRNPNLMTEDTSVSDGKLANVFVYIKDGTLADGKKIGDYSFGAPSDPVVLDQEGCHYRPHVLGVQTNQTVRITNSDPTQHNVHPTPRFNPEWNQTQASGAAPIERSFARAEVLIPVKCNQHPWMKAYIGVVRHPFYSVTSEDGKFEIKGLPPGTYTVAAWHEKGGPTGTEKTMQVTVPAKGSATADFSFDGSASASRRGGLEMMPALDLPMLGRH